MVRSSLKGSLSENSGEQAMLAGQECHVDVTLVKADPVNQEGKVGRN
jgi:hypothetical protein